MQLPTYPKQLHHTAFLVQPPLQGGDQTVAPGFNGIFNVEDTLALAALALLQVFDFLHDFLLRVRGFGGAGSSFGVTQAVLDASNFLRDNAILVYGGMFGAFIAFMMLKVL